MCLAKSQKLSNLQSYKTKAATFKHMRAAQEYLQYVDQSIKLLIFISQPLLQRLDMSLHNEILWHKLHF